MRELKKGPYFMRRSEVDNKRFDKYQLEKEQGGSLEVGLVESKKGR